MAELLTNPDIWWDARRKSAKVRPTPGELYVHLGRRATDDLRKTISHFVDTLKRCRDLEVGKKLHSDAAAASLDTHAYVAATLIKMYGKCQNMALARQVFERMASKDVVIWNNLIQGYVENGECSVAMDLFSGMDCTPNFHSYIAALKACTGLAGKKGSMKQFWLEKGIAIHKQVRDSCCDSRIVVATTLINMYCKCGSMERARDVFDGMVSKDIVSWNCLIQGYIQNGQSLAAMDLFAAMELDCQPDAVTYIAALKACGSLASETESEKQSCLEKGIAMHNQIRERGFGSQISVANTLVDMYGNCGSMQHAKEVFDSMVSKDVISWNALILGYVQNGGNLMAVDLFSSMDCEPDCFTYAAVLKACGSLACEESETTFYLEKGVAIHKQAKDRGFDNEIYVANSLVAMYSKFKSMHRAREVFDRMVWKSVVTWNSLIQGYVQNGEFLVGLDLFTAMDCRPDHFTYAAALKACGCLASEKESEKAFCLEKGIAIHKQARDCGFDSNIIVANTLVDMYCKCGSMQNAREVFDSMSCKDAVSWNALILGYIQNGESSAAMSLFSSIDCEPDSLTYVAALKACGDLASEKESDKQACLEKGISFHKQVKNRGFDSDIVVANTLVDMYSKCGSMQLAKEVFDGMLQKHIVAWTSLIQGYVLNGESLVALDLFTSMDCRPNHLTCVAALKACGTLAALPAGQQVHATACKLGLEQDQVLANALMDFYGKCGIVRRAEELFANMHSPNSVSWGSLIGGYSSSGDSSQVFKLGKSMREADFQIDGITLICILTACSHAGMVEEGKRYFNSVLRSGISLRMDHYNCMVDLLSRANRLQEALAFVRSMPFEGDAVTWKTLLGACVKWRNLEVGREALQGMVAAGIEDADAYALVKDMYRSLDVQSCCT